MPNKAGKNQLSEKPYRIGKFLAYLQLPRNWYNLRREDDRWKRPAESLPRQEDGKWKRPAECLPRREDGKWRLVRNWQSPLYYVRPFFG